MYHLKSSTTWRDPGFLMDSTSSSLPSLNVVTTVGCPNEISLYKNQKQKHLLSITKQVGLSETKQIEAKSESGIYHKDPDALQDHCVIL